MAHSVLASALGSACCWLAREGRRDRISQIRSVQRSRKLPRSCVPSLVIARAKLTDEIASEQVATLRSTIALSSLLSFLFKVIR